VPFLLWDVRVCSIFGRAVVSLAPEDPDLDPFAGFSDSDDGEPASKAPASADDVVIAVNSAHLPRFEDSDDSDGADVAADLLLAAQRDLSDPSAFLGTPSADHYIASSKPQSSSTFGVRSVGVRAALVPVDEDSKSPADWSSDEGAPPPPQPRASVPVDATVSNRNLGAFADSDSAESEDWAGDVFPSSRSAPVPPPAEESSSDSWGESPINEDDVVIDSELSWRPQAIARLATAVERLSSHHISLGPLAEELARTYHPRSKGSGLSSAPSLASSSREITRLSVALACFAAADEPRTVPDHGDEHPVLPPLLSGNHWELLSEAASWSCPLPPAFPDLSLLTKTSTIPGLLQPPSPSNPPPIPPVASTPARLSSSVPMSQGSSPLLPAGPSSADASSHPFPASGDGSNPAASTSRSEPPLELSPAATVAQLIPSFLSRILLSKRSGALHWASHSLSLDILTLQASSPPERAPEPSIEDETEPSDSVAPQRMSSSKLRNRLVVVTQPTSRAPPKAHRSDSEPVEDSSKPVSDLAWHCTQLIHQLGCLSTVSSALLSAVVALGETETMAYKAKLSIPWFQDPAPSKSSDTSAAPVTDASSSATALQHCVALVAAFDSSTDPLLSANLAERVATALSAVSMLRGKSDVSFLSVLLQLLSCFWNLLATCEPLIHQAKPSSTSATGSDPLAWTTGLRQLPSATSEPPSVHDTEYVPQLRQHASDLPRVWLRILEASEILPIPLSQRPTDSFPTVISHMADWCTSSVASLSSIAVLARVKSLASRFETEHNSVPSLHSPRSSLTRQMSYAASSSSRPSHKRRQSTPWAVSPGAQRQRSYERDPPTMGARLSSARSVDPTSDVPDLMARPEPSKHRRSVTDHPPKVPLLAPAPARATQTDLTREEPEHIVGCSLSSVLGLATDVQVCLNSIASIAETVAAVTALRADLPGPAVSHSVRATQLWRSAGSIVPGARHCAHVVATTLLATNALNLDVRVPPATHLASTDPAASASPTAWGRSLMVLRAAAASAALNVCSRQRLGLCLARRISESLGLLDSSDKKDWTDAASTLSGMPSEYPPVNSRILPSSDGICPAQASSSALKSLHQLENLTAAIGIGWVAGVACVGESWRALLLEAFASPESSSHSINLWQTGTNPGKAISSDLGREMANLCTSLLVPRPAGQTSSKGFPQCLFSHSSPVELRLFSAARLAGRHAEQTSSKGSLVPTVLTLQLPDPLGSVPAELDMSYFVSHIRSRPSPQPQQATSRSFTLQHGSFLDPLTRRSSSLVSTPATMRQISSVRSFRVDFPTRSSSMHESERLEDAGPSPFHDNPWIGAIVHCQANYALYSSLPAPHLLRSAVSSHTVAFSHTSQVSVTSTGVPRSDIGDTSSLSRSTVVPVDAFVAAELRPHLALLAASCRAGLEAGRVDEVWGLVSLLLPSLPLALWCEFIEQHEASPLATSVSPAVPTGLWSATWLQASPLSVNVALSTSFPPLPTRKVAFASWATLSCSPPSEADAGVGDDVALKTLLLVASALASSSNPEEALWPLSACLGQLWFPVRSRHQVTQLLDSGRAAPDRSLVSRYESGWARFVPLHRYSGSLVMEVECAREPLRTTGVAFPSVPILPHSNSLARLDGGGSPTSESSSAKNKRNGSRKVIGSTSSASLASSRVVPAAEIVVGRSHEGYGWEFDPQLCTQHWWRFESATRAAVQFAKALGSVGSIREQLVSLATVARCAALSDHTASLLGTCPKLNPPTTHSRRRHRRGKSDSISAKGSQTAISRSSVEPAGPPTVECNFLVSRSMTAELEFLAQQLEVCLACHSALAETFEVIGRVKSVRDPWALVTSQTFLDRCVWESDESLIHLSASSSSRSGAEASSFASTEWWCWLKSPRESSQGSLVDWACKSLVADAASWFPRIRVSSHPCATPPVVLGCAHSLALASRSWSLASGISLAIGVVRSVAAGLDGALTLVEAVPSADTADPPPPDLSVRSNPVNVVRAAQSVSSSLSLAGTHLASASRVISSGLLGGLLPMHTGIWPGGSANSLLATAAHVLGTSIRSKSKFRSYDSRRSLVHARMTSTPHPRRSSGIRQGFGRSWRFLSGTPSMVPWSCLWLPGLSELQQTLSHSSLMLMGDTSVVRSISGCTLRGCIVRWTGERRPELSLHARKFAVPVPWISGVPALTTPPLSACVDAEICAAECDFLRASCVLPSAASSNTSPPVFPPEAAHILGWDSREVESSLPSELPDWPAQAAAILVSVQTGLNLPQLEFRPRPLPIGPVSPNELFGRRALVRAVNRCVSLRQTLSLFGMQCSAFELFRPWRAKSRSTVSAWFDRLSRLILRMPCSVTQSFWGMLDCMATCREVLECVQAASHAAPSLGWVSTAAFRTLEAHDIRAKIQSHKRPESSTGSHDPGGTPPRRPLPVPSGANMPVASAVPRSTDPPESGSSAGLFLQDTPDLRLSQSVIQQLQSSAGRGRSIIHPTGPSFSWASYALGHEPASKPPLSPSHSHREHVPPSEEAARRSGHQHPSKRSQATPGLVSALRCLSDGLECSPCTGPGRMGALPHPSVGLASGGDRAADTLRCWHVVLKALTKSNEPLGAATSLPVESGVLDFGRGGPEVSIANTVLPVLFDTLKTEGEQLLASVASADDEDIAACTFRNARQFLFDKYRRISPVVLEARLDAEVHATVAHARSQRALRLWSIAAEHLLDRPLAAGELGASLEQSLQDCSRGLRLSRALWPLSWAWWFSSWRDAGLLPEFTPPDQSPPDTSPVHRTVPSRPDSSHVSEESPKASSGASNHHRHVSSPIHPSPPSESLPLAQRARSGSVPSKPESALYEVLPDTFEECRPHEWLQSHRMTELCAVLHRAATLSVRADQETPMLASLRRAIMVRGFDAGEVAMFAPGARSPSDRKASVLTHPPGFRRFAREEGVTRLWSLSSKSLYLEQSAAGAGDPSDAHIILQQSTAVSCATEADTLAKVLCGWPRLSFSDGSLTDASEPSHGGGGRLRDGLDHGCRSLLAHDLAEHLPGASTLEHDRLDREKLTEQVNLRIERLKHLWKHGLGKPDVVIDGIRYALIARSLQWQAESVPRSVRHAMTHKPSERSTFLANLRFAQGSKTSHMLPEFTLGPAIVVFACSHTALIPWEGLIARFRVFREHSSLSLVVSAARRSAIPPTSLERLHMRALPSAHDAVAQGWEHSSFSSHSLMPASPQLKPGERLRRGGGSTPSVAGSSRIIDEHSAGGPASLLADIIRRRLALVQKLRALDGDTPFPKTSPLLMAGLARSRAVEIIETPYELLVQPLWETSSEYSRTQSFVSVTRKHNHGGSSLAKHKFDRVSSRLPLESVLSSSGDAPPSPRGIDLGDDGSTTQHSEEPRESGTDVLLGSPPPPLVRSVPVATEVTDEAPPLPVEKQNHAKLLTVVKGKAADSPASNPLSTSQGLRERLRGTVKALQLEGSSNNLLDGTSAIAAADRPSLAIEPPTSVATHLGSSSSARFAPVTREPVLAHHSPAPDVVSAIPEHWGFDSLPFPDPQWSSESISSLPLDTPPRLVDILDDAGSRKLSVVTNLPMAADWIASVRTSRAIDAELVPAADRDSLSHCASFFALSALGLSALAPLPPPRPSGTESTLSTSSRILIVTGHSGDLGRHARHAHNAWSSPTKTTVLFPGPVSGSEISQEITSLLRAEHAALKALVVDLSSESARAVQLDDPRHWVWRLVSATKSCLAGANPVLMGVSVYYNGSS
jgi:hypothetical protein